MDILTYNSKAKIGCKICDKCCKNRGDIRIIPINVCRISKYLNISIEEFLNTYTNRFYRESLETTIKAHTENFWCMFYDIDERKCNIHPVKPMQCVMFPLVPENLKKDYFYNNEQCDFIPDEEIKIKDWLDGNNKIYSKNKKIYMEWISFIEWIEPILRDFSIEDIDRFYNYLYRNYDLNKNFEKQMIKNMRVIEKEVKEKIKKQ